MHEVTPGDRIDRFVVEARLGRGGMASVYRVRHTGLGSAHALKVLDLPHASVRGRLVLEGRVQAGLSHPNIVSVTDLVEVGGAPGLIMEYIAGPSLDTWLQANRPDAKMADALFRGILDGIGHAHREGLVHRDLKPGNVLLQEVGDRLVPKVADFGLVKLLGEEVGPSHTRTGFAMGTPGYMAPEQIRSAKDVDARADIFALGCILFEIWCGRRPFIADSVYDVLVAIERRDHPAPRSLRADLPLGAEAAILACLEPDRERRPPTVAAIRALLDADRAPAIVTPRPAHAAATIVPDALPPVSAFPPPVSTLPPVASDPRPPARDVAGTPARHAATARPPRPTSYLWLYVLIAVVLALLLAAGVGLLMFVGLLGGVAGLVADTGF